MDVVGRIFGCRYGIKTVRVQGVGNFERPRVGRQGGIVQRGGVGRKLRFERKVDVEAMRRKIGLRPRPHRHDEQHGQENLFQVVHWFDFELIENLIENIIDKQLYLGDLEQYSVTPCPNVKRMQATLYWGLSVGVFFISSNNLSQVQFQIFLLNFSLIVRAKFF